MDLAPAETPEPADPAPEVPGFRIERALGRGAFGRVYVAIREADGMEVALKVAHVRDDQRFHREAWALRTVGAPFAPTLAGEGHTTTGHPYLAEELLRSPSLASLMAGLPDSGALPLAEALPLMCRLCDAVTGVHKTGVVHRDLKPENVILCEDGRVVVLDFGLAVTASDPRKTEELLRLTQTGQRLGTLHYMAPEQCSADKHVDARADLYALGVILFELVTGRPPFVGDAAAVLQAHAERRPPRPSEFAPVPLALDEILLRLLAKDPERRFAGADGVAEALRRVDLRATQAPTVATVSKGPSRRAVALLSFRSTAELSQIEALAHGGRIERLLGDRHVLSFAHSPAASGVTAARRAGRALCELANGPLVVHVAELRVRERAGGLALSGLALERAADWAHVETEERVVLTPSALALAADSFDQAGSTPSTETLAPVETSPAELVLRGRHELQGELALHLGRALKEGTPTLSTIVGEVGYGKSRILETLALGIPQTTALRVISLRASSPEAGADLLLKELLTAVLECTDAGPALLRDTCHSLLGRGDGETAWPALALARGVLDRTAPAVQTLLAVPGALRHTLARVAGKALLRLAARTPLALLLDDAHWADPTTLDALEIATLAEEKVPLWIGVTTTPALLSLRPLWGDRAAKSSRHTLAPLSTEDTLDVLRDLLRPVEFVPEPVLLRLSEMTQGIPLHIVETVHALRTSGALRRHRGKGSWYVASEKVPELSATPLAEQLAQQALASLSGPLVALSHLCALLGEVVHIDEVDAISRTAIDVSELDPGVGLARLVRAGLLDPRGEGVFAFRHPSVRQAILALIPAVQKQALHRSLHTHLASKPYPDTADLRRLAWHASQAGAREEAFRACASIAEEFRQTHRYTEAEESYSAALAELAPDDPRRGAILAGRGRVRYRVQRFAEALDDTRGARLLAESRGDEAAQADLLLEEATILDWCDDWAGSAALVDRAFSLVTRLGDPLLLVRCSLGVGRTQWRQERVLEAIGTLTDVATRACEVEDRETRIVALLVLGTALAVTDRLDEAEARFGEVIDLCERQADRLHLGAAYLNRHFMWLKRQLLDEALDDLHRASVIARETGQAQLERWSAFNIAELFYWRGDFDRALPFAMRTRTLHVRALGHVPVAEDAILLARILCALGKEDEARSHLHWIQATCPTSTLTPRTQTLIEFVELQLAAKTPTTDLAPAWDALLVRAGATSLQDELLEILLGANAWARRQQDDSAAHRWLCKALDQPRLSAYWRKRFESD